MEGFQGHLCARLSYTLSTDGTHCRAWFDLRLHEFVVTNFKEGSQLRRRTTRDPFYRYKKYEEHKTNNLKQTVDKY